MQVEKNVVDDQIRKFLCKHFKDTKTNMKIAKIVQEKHRLDFPDTIGILTGKIDLLEVSDETTYWIIEALIEAYKETDIHVPFKIEDIYSEIEINKFRFSKMSTKKEKYPYKISDCIKVNEDQLVTVLNTKEIFNLYNNQMIRYNRLTQREPTIKKRNEMILSMITIVRSSVDAIANLMKKNLYISDDITLNLNPDTDVDYDITDNSVILQEGAFDIIDGFHRLMAIAENHRQDEDFSYNMVVNITNFNTEKAGRYIAQKDKRNKIKPAYSKSLDSTNEVTGILNRLNESNSYFKGDITRNSGSIIQWTPFFVLIDYCFKVRSKKDSFDIQRYLDNCLNQFAIMKGGYIEEIISNKELAVFVRCCSVAYQNGKSAEEAIDIMSKMNMENIHGQFPLGGQISAKTFRSIDKEMKCHV